jgi:Ser/Thr protein kinase RdoA (MazF antagonist)
VHKPPTPPSSPPPASPAPGTQADGRERFTDRELDEVLGRYELGAVRSVRQIPLGTPASPKAVIDCARGRLLLKRRARGVDAPEMVAFTHEVLLGCQKAGVCVPPLVGTREQNNSMVQVDDRVYELFVFIEGVADPQTPSSAANAGSLLAELHAAMDALAGSGLSWSAPVEAVVIDAGRAGRVGVDAEIRDAARGVLERAAGHARSSVRALVHGDWHPGNLVFRADEPVAACDFDNARLGSRDREVAQGLAQFSLVRGKAGEPAERWPAAADLDRLVAHWRGYRAGAHRPVGDVDAPSVVGLMPGVLMEEVLAGPSPDPRVVWMVLRKAQWLEDHAGAIRARLEEP